MPATVSHVLSATTPDDPLYEIRPSHWNSVHALTLNLTGSEIQNAFGNGGGVSFGLAGGVITAAAPAGAPSPINFSAGTTSSNIGSVVFADSNGISFGLNGSTITGTVKTDYLTTARGSTDAIGLNTAQTNVTWTVNSSGLSFNAAGYAGTTTAITGNASLTLNSLGLRFNGGGLAGTTTAITGNASITLNSDGFRLNGSGLAGVSTGFGGTNISGSMTLNSSGLNLSFSVAAQSNQSAIRGFGVSNTGATAGNTGISTGIDWVMAGSSLLTLSQSTAGGGPNTVWIQHPAWLTTARASNDGIGTNTAQTNVTWTVNSSGLSFNAGGYAGTSTTFNGANISGSMTHNTLGLALSLSVAAPGAAAENNAINLLGANTAGNTTVTGSTLGFSGINMTLSGALDSKLVFSVAAQSAQSAIRGFGVSNTGATAGNTGISTGIDWVIAGSNLITLSQSTAGGGPDTVWIQHPAWLTTARASNDGIGTNTAQTNVTWTVNSSGLSFNAAGYAGSSSGFAGAGISGSMTHNTSGLNLSLSVPATSSLVGINGISISTAGSTISVLPQWISSYENMEGIAGSVTLTFNAASISYGVAFLLPGPISASFIRVPALMTTNSTTIATMASATASASGAIFSTWNAVVYSLGAGANSLSLQSVASGSAGFTFRNSISITNSTQASYTLGFSAQANGAGTTRTTQYSVSNTNYSFTTDQIATEWSSNRMIDIPFANSLSPGAYWAIIGLSTSSASAGAAGLAALTNCNVRYSNHYAVSQMNLSFGIMGSTNMTSGGLMGAGSFSTAGGGTTNSIPISAISSNSNLARMYFQMLRSA